MAYFYALLFILGGLIFYVPFVYYKKVLPGMSKILTAIINNKITIKNCCCRQIPSRFSSRNSCSWPQLLLINLNNTLQQRFVLLFNQRYVTKQIRQLRVGINQLKMFNQGKNSYLIHCFSPPSLYHGPNNHNIQQRKQSYVVWPMSSSLSFFMSSLISGAASSVGRILSSWAAGAAASMSWPMLSISMLNGR